jgi:hypothetical protein
MEAVSHVSSPTAAVVAVGYSTTAPVSAARPMKPRTVLLEALALQLRQAYTTMAPTSAARATIMSASSDENGYAPVHEGGSTTPSSCTTAQKQTTFTRTHGL